uniref:Cytochrome P450, family 4, subfamily T, polypeptide 8 n=1 Tax=Monopterus albus TaxID=43700 RepID=A0A3Q3JGE6_MONAL
MIVLVFIEMIHHYKSGQRSVLYLIFYWAIGYVGLSPEVNITKFIFVCFLTEPKADFVYKFVEDWIGKTDLPFSCSLLWLITALFILFVCLFWFFGFIHTPAVCLFSGEGLLVSQGQKWFQHRRLLTPGFHYDVLKPYVKLMSDSAKTMLKKWERYANTNEPFELFEHVSLMTLDSILKCAFSYSSNCQTERLLAKTGCFMLNHEWRYEVIRKRKEALKKEKELKHIQAKRNLDFLDILLFAREQQGLSDEDIRAEVDTFMFEGHDTTASGISFTLYCLACHPEHQKLCRDEIIEALDGKDTMDKIPYTTMCIKESLRLYPPVPGIFRRTTKPITFFDGRTLPEGLWCICVSNYKQTKKRCLC